MGIFIMSGGAQQATATSTRCAPSARPSSWLGVAMVLDVIFRRLVRVPCGQLRMTVCYQRLMRGMGVVAFFVMLGRIAVMSRGQFVMIGSGDMMFGARERFRHGVSFAVVGWTSASPNREAGSALPLQ